MRCLVYRLAGIDCLQRLMVVAAHAMMRTCGVLLPASARFLDFLAAKQATLGRCGRRKLLLQASSVANLGLPVILRCRVRA